jgi:hypothetical protein
MRRTLPSRRRLVAEATSSGQVIYLLVLSLFGTDFLGWTASLNPTRHLHLLWLFFFLDRSLSFIVYRFCFGDGVWSSNGRISLSFFFWYFAKHLFLVFCSREENPSSSSVVRIDPIVQFFAGWLCTGPRILKVCPKPCSATK